MLELKKINKSYKTGTFVQRALKDVSIKFRKNEFVAILGQSGSGKTTLLNIIGGLDRYDSGDLIINSKSTKKFKSIDWDRYRNNCVGFIFQSYNLIPHITIIYIVRFLFKFWLLTIHCKFSNYIAICFLILNICPCLKRIGETLF